jgi:hypothetical protein
MVFPLFFIFSSLYKTEGYSSSFLDKKIRMICKLSRVEGAVEERGLYSGC